MKNMERAVKKSDFPKADFSKYGGDKILPSLPRLPECLSTDTPTWYHRDGQEKELVFVKELSVDHWLYPRKKHSLDWARIVMKPFPSGTSEHPPRSHNAKDLRAKYLSRICNVAFSQLHRSQLPSRSTTTTIP